MALQVHDLTPLLEVFDLPTSVAFYRDVLGLRWSRAMSRGGACSSSVRLR